MLPLHHHGPHNGDNKMSRQSRTGKVDHWSIAHDLPGEFKMILSTRYSVTVEKVENVGGKEIRINVLCRVGHREI